MPRQLRLPLDDLDRALPNLERRGLNPKRLRFTWETLARGEGPAARFTLMPGDVVVAE